MIDFPTARVVDTGHRKTAGPRSAAPATEPFGIERRVASSLARHMPTSFQKVNIVHVQRAGAIVLTGQVSSFYTKQVVYQFCRKQASGLDVIDALEVANLNTAHCWTVGTVDSKAT